MASSSSASASLTQAKHHVFLSFRGEDTRNTFLSHLYEALKGKGVGAYADFKELPRGEEISSALLEAIEKSMISVIVFSQTYATSSWCLDELSKIMECRDSRGQLVVPIFYHVNPSDIRKLKGSFEEAFVDHERNRIDKVKGWRLALTKAAGLSGWHIAGDKPEPTVIEDIVKDIVNKLDRLSKGDCEGLIGIFPRMEQIKSLLCIGGEDVRIIGIWGMPGIGKTTLAQAIYDEVRGQFESYYFLADVREKLETPVANAITLRDQLLSQLLNQHGLHIGTPRMPFLIKDRLRRKKVLLVLDDVNDWDQLEKLEISHDHFGSGSRIIITSRNKQVLINGSVDETYKAKGLGYNDSIKLFSLHAFKQNGLVDDYKDVSNKFLEYAKGVPLALKVLGSTVCEKNKAYWESALNKKENKLGMHDLLQEMGRIIISSESRWAEECSRLWNSDDVCKVLKKGKGTKSVEGILLDLSQINNEVQLHPRAFARMPNLRIIKFYDPTFSGKGGMLVPSHKGLKSLPDELRYFHWENCMLKSMPSNFSPKNLVELRLSGRNFELLWNGDQNLENLRVLDLSDCKNLIRIPSLSASKNIEQLKISGCESLVELPSMVHLTSLCFSLLGYGLKNLKKFPELPQHIEELTLTCTAISFYMCSLFTSFSYRVTNLHHKTFLFSVMASSSSASASSTQAKHHVFLSFRGEDTRNAFLRHLYEAFKRKGIGAYVDFNELTRGEEISPALLEAIEESMISVIVFSQNYATSSWCLDELSKIMECRDSREQLVVPIFYHVNPSDIRKLKGSFEEAFVDHERNRTDKVKGWRDALTKAAKLSGWTFQDMRLRGLNGIVPPMEQIKSLLCIEEKKDVCIIGIWGMAGIGKTTLAQAISDEVSGEFESCYFLADVRATIGKQRANAITLRDRFLSKLLNEDSLDIGAPRMPIFIKDRLCRKRVLLVLDDVSEWDQLENLGISHDHFGSGSRIIVTSRNKQVLTNGSVDGIYKVKKLSHNDSIRFFSMYAFKQDHLVDDLKDLSNKFLEYAKGVPLALKVLGSALYQKNKAYWTSALNGLKQHSNPEINDVLKISYDGLADVEEKIFLDIAIFFKGCGRDSVTKILDGCYDDAAHSKITDLVDKCLLNVTIENKLGMHDLLQEMGREIIRSESKWPEERSRLWTPNDVCNVLKNGKGTKSVEGILLDLSQINEVQLHPRAFARMPNLRIIKFYHHTFSGKGGMLVPSHQGLKSLPDEFRYFHWENCMLKSMPSNFSPKNLVELRLSGRNFEQLWNGDQNLENLRVLDLSFCKNLTRIPSLSASKNIEQLEISWCESLVELPSMVHLKSLCFSLSGCGLKNLKKFPELPQHTKRLILTDTAIEEIPESIGFLHQLAFLDMSGGRIHNLPSTIIQLHALKDIRLCDCPNITNFPIVPAKIEVLYLDNTPVEEFWTGDQNLENLRVLDLRFCKNLTRIPSLSASKNIEQLEISGCESLVELPSMVHLKSLLSRLRGEGLTNLKKFPELPQHIEELILTGTAIEEIPESIGFLHQFAFLDMIGGRIRNIPSTIIQLHALKDIRLRDCPNIKNFPIVPENIEMLDLDNTRIKKVPSSISRLKSLTAFRMRGCTRLKRLPTSICKLKSLIYFDLYGCSNLERFPEILETMECLGYRGSEETAITVLSADIYRRVSLEFLNLSGSDIVEIPKSIKQLPNLCSLCLNNFKNLKPLPELPCLQILEAENCKSLKRVHQWKHLQYVEARTYKLLRRSLIPQSDDDFFEFHNCFNLERDAVNNIVANAQLKAQCTEKVDAIGSFVAADRAYSNCFFSCFPGSKIPKTFKNRSKNSSITVKLGPACSSKRILGFLLCIVLILSALINSNISMLIANVY
ncbi:disease resistance protein RPP4-like [Durio zibethinus]|uniref:ADP-ribosyl cyclase/cyclic ADP-ribose hydrolase n=1 Tax=Durio zibethinus TaxID=66656 RepID=A0A6P6AXJ1_DURZI|nr:disease resistance protein RPP4-like [Durio zibethinus]